MRTIIAYFGIIRWSNLVFIAFTQFLFYHFVFKSLQPAETTSGDLINNAWLFVLIIASMLIAGAGYIINDYFDVQIDEVNKPKKVYIDRAIKRRWAIFWHGFLSGTGILLSGLVSNKTGVWIIFYGNIICVILLWVYSTHLKKKLLWGNFSISLLTSWTIVVIYFFSGGKLFNYRHSFEYNINQFVKLTILYAGFAFVLTMIREVVKDLEDIPGDEQFGCNTMPIRWGITASKVFAGVWIFVATCSLTILALYLIQKGMFWIGSYTLILLVSPLILLSKKLIDAQLSSDYHTISRFIKLLMMAGILSMLFF